MKKAILIGTNFSKTLFACSNNTIDMLNSIKCERYDLLNDYTLQKPTKEIIIKRMISFFKNSKPNDELLIYLSCHTKKYSNCFAIECYDGSLLTNNFLKEIINTYCKTNTQLCIILDTCFSNKFFNLDYSYTNSGLKKNNYINSFDKKIKNIIFLSGSDEETYLVNIYNKKKSIFTYNLLKCIKKYHNINHIFPILNKQIKPYRFSFQCNNSIMDRNNWINSLFI